MNHPPDTHSRPSTPPSSAASAPARNSSGDLLTGRLDWKKIIAEAELPGPLAELVTEVVRRSRLWRSERVDLARELCTHFSDGLEKGNTKEQLMHNFGDPKNASALIRRAKKRGRHWTYRAFVHAAQGLGAILIAGFILYALLAWRFYSGEPTIARNYTAEYNQTIEQIPKNDRAWDLYMETYARLDRHPVTDLHRWPAIAPEHPRYAEALEFLTAQQDVLEIVHRAADKPHLGAFFSDALDPRLVDADNARNPEANLEYQNPSENPLFINILFPELGHMRNLARLLTFDAHVAARAGESDRVLRDIRSMLGIGEHANDRPVLISSLVALAIDHLAINTTAQIIHEYPDLFTDEQLRELARRHAGFMDGNPRVDLTGERWFFEDVVQRVYTDDGHGNGHATAEGLRIMAGLSDGYDLTDHWRSGALLTAPVLASLVANRTDLVAKYDEFMTQMEHNAKLPMWKYDNRADADVQIELLNVDPIQKIRYFPIVLLLPAIDRASHAAEIATQHRDGLLTGIALELYRRDHGTYPDSLDALVPAYLPAVPPDRFTGKPLNYAIVDGQPRLWSVGADRNDDNGVPPPERRSYEDNWSPLAQARINEQQEPDRHDGDWILWPIVYEPVTGGEEE